MSKVPVFKLFSKVGHCRSTREILEESALNFTVEKRILTVDTGGESSLITKMPHHVGVVRTDKCARPAILGCVGRNFGLIQCSDIIEFCDAFTLDGENEFYAAGAPNYGEKVYVVMKQPQWVDLGSGDRVESYFCITSAHDGSGCFHAMPAYLRTLTQTLITPAHSGAKLKIRHTKNAMEALEKAREVTHELAKYWTHYVEDFQGFANIKLDKDMAETYFKLLVPGDKTRAENIRAKMWDLYTLHGDACKYPSCNGTLLGAMTAAMEYAEYYQTVKSSKHRDQTAARIASRLHGSAAELKAKAIKMCYQMQDLGKDGYFFIKE